MWLGIISLALTFASLAWSKVRVYTRPQAVRQKEQGPERVASLEAPDSSGVGGRDR